MATSDSLSKANISFTLDLFKTLGNQNKTSNVSFSPFSVSAALSMLLLGAKGSTANQMREVGLKGALYVHSSFAALLKELKNTDSLDVLSVANRLYGDQSCKFIKKFVEETRQLYDADVETMDFVKKAEEARIQMNCWVEKQTQGKIKDLLAKDAVNSTTKLVLVNAIYLKADWKNQFNKELTRNAEFSLNKYKCIHLDSDINIIFLKQLPYKYRNLSMLIFLPNGIEDSTTGLEKLEQQLTYESFVEWTRRDKMYLYQVDLSLPQFRIEQNYELSGVLKNMGMEDAFDYLKCDFSDLMVSQVVHRAFVDVNDRGTEAAAYTRSLVVQSCILPPPRVTFNADHPFIFFIRHNATSTILFAGRFCSEQ
uniref:Serpin B6 n=1 Tax=Periophthalmus magnuspinnatus TaxID=409849 RepID=A0A3B4ARX9_9GOBI